MTRAHVKLLGPCFKTGRIERGTITTPGMKVREFHPTKGGLTPKGSFRRTEYQLQSGSASSTGKLAAVTRKRANDNQLQTGPWTSPQLAVVARGKSHGTTATIRHTGSTSPWGNVNHSAEKPLSNTECPSTHGLFHPFTSEQFHALFNSLFKVLFNFPSRYLFAIGLACIFSLGWGLPPI